MDGVLVGAEAGVVAVEDLGGVAGVGGWLNLMRREGCGGGWWGEGGGGAFGSGHGGGWLRIGFGGEELSVFLGEGVDIAAYVEDTSRS